MQTNDELFALSPRPSMQVEMLGGSVPVLVIDNVYANPDEVRAQGLALPFAPPTLHYPGRTAPPPEGSPSLDRFRSWVLGLVNTTYLSLTPLSFEGRSVVAFKDVQTDFAIVDVHPDDLHPAQRRPHVDPLPLFGLVYLNREERGGTLFFERTGDAEGDISAGYFTDGSQQFRLLGRIAPAFNRLAIYPGSVPHSGEIVGDWIRSDARSRDPPPDAKAHVRARLNGQARHLSAPEFPEVGEVTASHFVTPSLARLLCLAYPPGPCALAASSSSSSS